MPERALWALGVARAEAEAFFGPGSDISERPVVSCNHSDYMKPHSLTRWWARNRKGYGLPDCRIHDLRHTYATLLIENGADPFATADNMGHADLSMLRKVYVNVHDEARVQAVNNVVAFSRTA